MAEICGQDGGENLPAGLGGLGWTPLFDRLMKNRVTLLNKMIGTATPLGFVFRWAVEQLHKRVASGEPVGSSGRIQEYVSQNRGNRGRWLDQEYLWMEEKELVLVGGSAMPGAMYGDVTVVDMVEMEQERAVLRKAAAYMDRYWLSQLLGSTDADILTPSGVPEKDGWKAIVE